MARLESVLLGCAIDDIFLLKVSESNGYCCIVSLQLDLVVGVKVGKVSQSRYVVIRRW